MSHFKVSPSAALILCGPFWMSGQRYIFLSFLVKTLFELILGSMQMLFMRNSEELIQDGSLDMS